MRTLKSIFYRIFGEDRYGRGLDQAVNVVLLVSLVYIVARVVL